MGQPSTEIATRDLVDRLEATLPRASPGDTARRIVEVMGRIGRAATATAYRERAGMLRWIAGPRLPELALRSIRTALRHSRGARASSIWIGESGTGGWDRAWVMWSGRPHDAERDVLYMQGPALRPVEACTGRLERLLALLGELP